jgi:hypothetical protein
MKGLITFTSTLKAFVDEPAIAKLKKDFLEKRAGIKCFIIYLLVCEILGLLSNFVSLVASSSNLRVLRTIRLFRGFLGFFMLDDICFLVLLYFLFKFAMKGHGKKVRLCRIVLTIILLE